MRGPWESFAGISPADVTCIKSPAEGSLVSLSLLLSSAKSEGQRTRLHLNVLKHWSEGAAPLKLPAPVLTSNGLGLGHGWLLRV